MTIAELFPTLRSLPRADKLKVMQFLIAEISKDEEPSLQPGATYLLSSPLNSHAAAQKLAQLLDSEQATNVWDKMEKFQCDQVQVRSL